MGATVRTAAVAVALDLGVRDGIARGIIGATGCVCWRRRG